MTNDSLTASFEKIKHLPKEEIYKDLLSKGYKIADIESRFVSNSKDVNGSVPQTWTKIDTEPAPSQTDRKISPKTEQIDQPSDHPDKNKSLLVTIMGIVGSSVLGIGVISMVAANWSYIDNIFPGLRLIILVTSTLVFHLSALALKWVWKLERIASALHLAGSLVFGASLFLIGQIYNLPVESVDMFYIWIIGVGALGIILNGFLHDYLALIITAIAGLTIPFSTFVGYYRYQYTPNGSQKELVTLTLTLLSVLIFTAWAYFHRVRNNDSELKNFF